MIYEGSLMNIKRISPNAMSQKLPKCHQNRAYFLLAHI